MPEFIEQYDKKVSLDSARMEMRITDEDARNIENLKAQGISGTVIDNVLRKQHEKKERKKQINEMLKGEQDTAVQESLRRMLQEAH